jgi:hypothetical protein
MDFSTKLAQTRLYATDNQLGVDSQEVYNEGILQSLDLISEKSLEIVDYLSVIALNQETLINIFKGIEPSLLSGGLANVQQSQGVQVGNNLIFSESGAFGVFDDNVSIGNDILRGIEPSLLSAGEPNLPQERGVQIGNENVFL